MLLYRICYLRCNLSVVLVFKWIKSHFSSKAVYFLDKANIFVPCEEHVTCMFWLSCQNNKICEDLCIYKYNQLSCITTLTVMNKI